MIRNIYILTVLLLSIIYPRECLIKHDPDERPVRPEKDTFSISPSGYFYIHYDTTGNAAPDISDTNINGIPDYVDEVSVIADSAHHVLVDVMGYEEEPYDGEGGYDIYIMDLDPGEYGYTHFEGNGISYLRIDKNYVGYSSPTPPIKLMHVTLSHVYFHAIQKGYKPNYSVNDKYFLEMTSTWFEDVLVPDGNDYLNDWVDDLLDDPTADFDNTESGHELALFGHYLSSFIDPNGEFDAKQSTVMREMWERFGATNSTALSAAEYVLDGENYSLTFIEAWTDFISRNLYNGMYEDIENPFYYYGDQALIEPIVTNPELLDNSRDFVLDLDNESVAIQSFLLGSVDTLCINHSSDEYLGRISIVSTGDYNDLFWATDTCVSLISASEIYFIYGSENAADSVTVNLDVNIEDGDVFGCTNPEACNYDETATADDGSCKYEVDECGICGGSGIPAGECDCIGNVEDCAGVCGGVGILDGDGICCETGIVDECGVCGGTGFACGEPEIMIEYPIDGDTLYLSVNDSIWVYIWMNDFENGINGYIHYNVDEDNSSYDNYGIVIEKHFDLIYLSSGEHTLKVWLVDNEHNILYDTDGNTIEDIVNFYIIRVGCTDPNACNYDADATVADDSCEYPVIQTGGLDMLTFELPPFSNLTGSVAIEFVENSFLDEGYEQTVDVASVSLILSGVSECENEWGQCYWSDDTLKIYRPDEVNPWDDNWKLVIDDYGIRLDIDFENIEGIDIGNGGWWWDDQLWGNFDFHFETNENIDLNDLPPLITSEYFDIHLFIDFLIQDVHWNNDYSFGDGIDLIFTGITAPVYACDCDGNILDECGECGGDNSSCIDDCGIINGNNLDIDECGECFGNGYDMCDGDNDGISNIEDWGYGAHDIIITDIPNDQGGRVYIEFVRSFYDTDTLRSTESYQIERLDDEQWVGVATQNAYGSSTYIVEATTFSNNDTTQFRVIASMNEGNFVCLENGFGMSIDNIAPATPENFMAFHDGSDITLNWQYELEEDFDYHEITGLWNTTYSIENTLDFSLSFYHDEERIQSVDINDNKSEQSESVFLLKLHAGANLISINVLPEDVSVENIFSNLGDNVGGIIGEGVGAVLLNGTWIGSLTEISSKKGYWLKVNEEDILIVIGEPVGTEISYDLHYGNNLISYPYRYPTPIADALPEGIGCDISGMIGEGIAAYCNESLGWLGSLSSLEGSYGYWIAVTEPMAIIFNGCNDAECASLSRESQNLSTIPEGYEFAQSTKQAFYFIEDIENIEIGDWILAYNGDVVIGAREWTGSIIDVPAMGNDGSDYTKGYLEAGSVPSFKILRDDELIDLEGDISSWENNQLYMVSSLTEAVALPETFSLDRAYPNPFNPTTTLSFAIPVDSEVSLSVYNLQGREVSTLIDGNMDAGYHSIVWDANSYASGVYFVKMVAGDFVNTQKLMLIK